jgi:hypothetical protein
VKKLNLLLLATAAVAAAIEMPDAVHDLAQARQELAAMQQLATQPIGKPPPLMAEGRAIVGQDHAKAAQRLVDQLRVAAGRRGVLIEEISIVAADPAARPLLRIRLVATGAERALLRYINEVERAERPVRFAVWQLAPRVSDSALQLQGEAVAIWRPT